MKITTLPSFFGQTVAIWEGKEIKFDSSGSCEVSKEIGAKLIETYPSFMFNGVKVEDKVFTVEDEVNQDLVNRLQGEIFDLKAQVVEAKAETKSAIADTDQWKDSVSKLNERAVNAEKTVADQNESYGEQIRNFELKVTLMNSSTQELKKLCEDSGYDQKEWGLLTKEKIIEYIMKN